jgi:hypothetical protein
MDENHCNVCACAWRRLFEAGLEIELVRCKLTSAGTSASAEVLGRNQGPTKLHYCRIDNFVIAMGCAETIV